MPSVSVRVPHELDRATAIARLQQYSQAMKDQHGSRVSELEETWSDSGSAEFSFRALGFSISGRTVVHAEFAEIHVHLPFAAIAFRGMIEKEIANRLESALAGGPA